MNELTFFFSLFCGSIVAIYLLWFICNFNGKIIFYLTRTVLGTFGDRNFNNHPPFEPFYSDISLPAICLTGILPLAILSISVSLLDSCFNSVSATGILELALGLIFIFIHASVKQEFDLFGINIIRQNLSLVLSTVLWCFLFSFWAVLNHQTSFDRTISNTNPDMWAYVRRFAAFTTDNLDFYGGRDSFIFKSNSACAFLLGSPKKLSSFLGSLIVYIFNGSALGIAIFQGMLGAALLMCLFREWLNIQSIENGFSLGKLTSLLWVLFSPSIYWLLISAYFSNTLFIIVVCLSLREARRIGISGDINRIENLVCLFSILTVVFAFYPAFLPLIVIVYIVPILIYLPYQTLERAKIIRAGIGLAVVISSCGLLFYTLFPSQLGLYEVKKSLNLLAEHGANFVPLNPWSLLQEKPKPMPNIRDFGWHINIIIGLIASIFTFVKVWQIYRKDRDKNLLAGAIGIGVYTGYLLAYIPLETTYRLMKIAISIIYPLAIFGLLPLILWCNSRLISKYYWMRNAILAFGIAHAIIHLYVVFDLYPYPSGSLTLSRKSILEKATIISVIGCQDVHESQFYERLVGLQIARQYPNVQVNVFHSIKDSVDSPKADIVLYGRTIATQTSKTKGCHFSF